MNYDEYKHELNLLQTEFDNKKEQLYSKYAFANNLVKIGDNVTDHFHTIKVESIKVHGHQVCFHYAIDYSQKPNCVYFGSELTKTGAIKKKNPDNYLYQCNLTLINGIPL